MIVCFQGWKHQRRASGVGAANAVLIATLSQKEQRPLGMHLAARERMGERLARPPQRVPGP
eukprot:2141841-Rhodomonas_salina.2